MWLNEARTDIPIHLMSPNPGPGHGGMSCASPSKPTFSMAWRHNRNAKNAQSRAYILSFFTGYLGVLMGFRFALDRIQIARSRVAGLHKDRILQVAAIRELAKTSLTSKRKVKDSELLVERLDAETQSLEERLKTVKRADNRLVVLDERRLPEDHPWIHGNFRSRRSASRSEG